MISKYKISILTGVVLFSLSAVVLNDYLNTISKTQNNIAQSNPVSLVQERVIERANVEQSWLDQVIANITKESFFFSMANENTYRVYNQNTGLRFTITEDGFHVAGNIMDKGEWNASLLFEDILFDNFSISKGELKSIKKSDNKLTYFFENFAVEYINSEEGLRQNFISYKNVNDAKNISVRLQIDSKLNAHVVNNNLILTRNNIQLYTYRDLKVWDSEGQSLTAKMELIDGNILALNTNVSEASFPVTIDPLSSAYSWLTTGGSLKAGYGFWIAGNGDVNGDGFDDVAIGAPDLTNTLSRQGAFFIYHGSASGLSTTPALVVYGDIEEASLGKCLSIEGDVNGDGYSDLVVGAHQYSNPTKYEGRAYLHLGGPDGINPVPVWQMESNRKGAKLGEAVTIAGDLNGDGFDDIAIGVHGWDNTEEMGDAGNKAGKFLVFNGTSSGIDPIPAMECVADVEDANLGISMDRAGDVNGDGYDDLHIGGYIFLIGDGMLCTFHGGPGGADVIPDFMAIGGSHDTSFYAVNLSTAGDLNGDGFMDVVVGAPRFDAGGIYQAGKLHIHYGGPGGLDTAIGFTLNGIHYDQRYAFNVNDARDINNDGYDDLLVTSKFFSETPGDSLSARGKVYLYLGGPNGPQTEPVWSFVGPSPQAIGTNIALAGDVNGDGQEDIILSGSSYTGSFYSEGAVYMFNGIPQVCDAPENLTLNSFSATSASLQWDWLFGATTYKVYLKKVGTPGAPIALNTMNSAITLTGLSPASTYKVYVKARCEAGFTSRSNTVTITTPPMRINEEIQEISLYPNPVRNTINISTGNMRGTTQVTIYNLAGEIVFHSTYTLDNNAKVITINDVATLSDGVYIMQMNNAGSIITKKFTKSS